MVFSRILQATVNGIPDDSMLFKMEVTKLGWMPLVVIDKGVNLIYGKM
jgi:hypothetical protein